MTVGELEKWLRSNEIDRDLVTALGIAAREWFETAMDRQLTTAAWRLTLDGFGGSCIELPYPPLRSVSSVQYLDADGATQTLDADTYVVVTTETPGRIELADGESWPATAVHPAAVTINFQAGYGAPGDVPELVKVGIKLLAAHWYENRGDRDAKAVPMAVESIAWNCGAYRF